MEDAGVVEAVESEAIDDGHVFRSAWPGPGNSEGPVSPGPWPDPAPAGKGSAAGWDAEAALRVTSPWPGPGDSEG